MHGRLIFQDDGFSLSLFLFYSCLELFIIRFVHLINKFISFQFRYSLGLVHYHLCIGYLLFEHVDSVSNSENRSSSLRWFWRFVFSHAMNYYFKIKYFNLFILLIFQMTMMTALHYRQLQMKNLDHLLDVCPNSNFGK